MELKDFAPYIPNKPLAHLLPRARSLKHPYTTALALTWAAVVRQGRREAEAAQEYAEALVALAQEQEFPYWLGFGLLLRGWAVAVQGKKVVGCEQVRQGLTALQATGTIVGLRFGATLLAEAYGKSGEIEEGLAAVTEVLRTLDQPGERLWDAELYRLKGELTLAQSNVQSLASSVASTQHPTPSTQEAEACFQQALEIAQQQSAKLWELRAATSLARL